MSVQEAAQSSTLFLLSPIPSWIFLLIVVSIRNPCGYDRGGGGKGAGLEGFNCGSQKPQNHIECLQNVRCDGERDNRYFLVQRSCLFFSLFFAGWLFWYTVVENILIPRQPLRKLDAIYFLSPTKESVEALIKDWDREKPLYAHAHLFFIERTSSTPTTCTIREKLIRFQTYLTIYSNWSRNLNWSARSRLLRSWTSTFWVPLLLEGNCS